MKHIPNIITCLNLLCGTLAIVCAFKLHFDYALYLIILAAVFDFLDGFFARLLKAYSDIGKELDSLSDLISFGLAPSMIFYNYASQIPDLPVFLTFVPFLVVVFSALRLAIFNTDQSQKNIFKGVPTPIIGLLLSSFVFCATLFPHIQRVLSYEASIPMLTALLCALLVCRVPMFSLKIKNFSWGGNKTLYIYLALIVALSILTLLLSESFFLLFFRLLYSYILINILSYIFSGKK